MAVKTPPTDDVARLANENSSFLSTPGCVGSANLREDCLSDVARSVVAPWLVRDIENHQTCNVNKLLEFFLCMCSGKQDPPPLLDKCIQSVLPLVGKLKPLLDTYCETAGPEPCRYHPFVMLANTALRLLEDISIEDGGLELMPKLKPSNIMCFRNDPKTIQGEHNKVQSKRSPNIAWVPLEVALNAVKDDEDEVLSWSTIAFGPAAHKPKSSYANLAWPQLDGCADLKLKKKTIPKLPCAHDFLSSMKSIDPLTYAKDDVEKSPSNSIAPSQSTRSSTRSKETTRSSSRLSRNPGTKRMRDACDNDLEEHARQRKRQTPNRRLKGNMDHPITQCASYGVELLSRSIGTCHAIVLLVTDDVAHIWWYDRQGAIQSDGINIVLDFPRFLVLLLALQRFKKSDWGLNPYFQNPDELSLTGDDGQTFHFSLPQTKGLYHQYGLAGRATRVLPCTLSPADSPDTQAPLSTASHVLKVFWPASSRVPEQCILAKAKEIGSRLKNSVEDHIPTLLAGRTFPETSTSIIREKLGIALEANRGPCEMQILLFPTYRPIAELYGFELWDAVWDCIDCHHDLWHNGVLHRDVSVNNLMYYRPDGGRPRGILIDFDLATLEVKGEPQPVNTERTGTIPFMALELTTKEAWEGKVKHCYHHDLESFFWVFIWLCTGYQKGKPTFKDLHPRQAWASPDYTISHEKRATFLLDELHDDLWTKNFTGKWEILIGMMVTRLWLDFQKNLKHATPFVGDTIEFLAKLERRFDSAIPLTQNRVVGVDYANLRKETKVFREEVAPAGKRIALEEQEAGYD